MSRYRRWSKPLSSALWLVVTVAVWIVFAPIQAGGRAAYIVVIGKSMEPNFHLGDLIIVQQDSNYKIGDIVAYKNAQLNNNVFHRIIGVENRHYILKGDNNSWVDTYQPSSEEVIGKLWVYLPGVGKIIQRIRTPLNMALIVGVLAGVALFSSWKEKPKGIKRMNKKSLQERISDLADRLKFRNRIPQKETVSTSDPQTDSDKPATLHRMSGPSKGPFPEFMGSSVEILFFALGLAAFASLILAIISFTRPATISQPDDVNYQHIGIFSYSASAPAGIYDSNTVQKGEPIFPKVTCSARVDFHYSLFGDSLKDIAGTYGLTAQIVESQSGWQRTVTLLPETSFTGNSFDTNAIIDLCQIIDLTESMEQGTEFHPSQYTLLVTPHVNVSGKIAGRDLQDLYEPQLAFKFDRLNFSMIQTDTELDPFNQSQTGFIREISRQANTMSLFGLQPEVLTLRLIGCIGLVLSLAGMGLLERQIRSFTSKSPDAVIQLKYGTMVIDVHNEDFEQTSRAVIVNSIDDLAKLAERYNAMILHETREGENIYYLRADGTTYRFSSGRHMVHSTEEKPK